MVRSRVKQRGGRRGRALTYTRRSWHNRALRAGDSPPLRPHVDDQLAEPPSVNPWKTPSPQEKVESCQRLEDEEFPSLRRGDTDEGQRTPKTKGAKMLPNFSVDVSFGLILLRPEMKTKERSAAQKMQNRVVSLSPSAAEMGDHQRVLRRESPPPSPQETASTSESSTTRDDQSAPESETEAEVEAVKEAPAPAPAPAPASSPAPAPAPGLECDASDHSFLQIPELELNRLLQEKEARIDRIVGENCDLLRQAERLRRLISDVVEDKAGLTVELSSVTKAELNSDLKVRDQETAVHAERQKTSEAESRLVGETEQVSRLAAALTRARDDLEESGRRREWDTSRLRAEGAEETSGLAAALLCVREDERRERLRWQSELFALRESLDAAKRLLEASQEETAKCTEELMERIRSLETTMEEMKSEAEEKKTTTASLWRRFLQLIA